MYEGILSWPFYLKLASVLISIMILGYLAIQGQDLIIPMIMGLLFAILLVPVCNFLERKLRFNRSISAIVVSVLGLTLIGLILYLIGIQTTSFRKTGQLFRNRLLQLLIVFRIGLLINSVYKSTNSLLILMTLHKSH